MKKVLIFAGTKEGRMLAEHVCRFDREVHISVATEYGEEVLPRIGNLTVHRGRLTEGQMEELLRQETWEHVIDATHPYAVEVSVNVKQACENTGIPYLRLKRSEGDVWGDGNAVYVDSVQEAADYLNRQSGNILLTTGSKDLTEYVRLIGDTERIFARILPDGDTVKQCREMGLLGSRIICMQGPFSAQLNEAMLRQIQAKFLVTKDTGATGGLPQKLEGAKKAGATVVIIRRPTEEQGYSMEALLEYLQMPPLENESEQKVALIGIGMGNADGMTREACRCCEQADLILGAARMVETLEPFGKKMVVMYQPEAVTEYIRIHPEYRNVVVAFSGDVGFYSGAEKMLAALAEIGIKAELLCGISSVEYAAAKFHLAWQDMALMSNHGRLQNIIGKLNTSKKVFSLMGKKESVSALARTLLDYGMEDVTMHVGCRLSYPEETLASGTPEQFVDFDADGLAVVILENPHAEDAVVTHGLPDEMFVRGEVPMTKEEVRSISLSKLALTKNAVVYDIGAGTGSIGMECALQAPEGVVYAIEKKSEAIALIEKNRRRLKAANLEIVEGNAPDVCENLPNPTHAFIGGSGGSMRAIIDVLLRKNPKVRIVINAISLETVAEVTEILKEQRFAYEDVAQVSVAKAKTLGQYHMMLGQNPVFIFTLQN